MTQRVHHMPFGAALLEGGGVAFKLWAPDARRVDLQLEGRGTSLTCPMENDDGWFTFTAPDAAAGMLYRFVIDGGLAVPDPASRYQPYDVHGPSQVVDPALWTWADDGWKGRPWAEAVIYELHVGAFSPDGTFDGVRKRLDYLVELGITAIQLMPLADFPGRCNWGYDGALLFAPDSRYGTPDDLKALVEQAHQKGLMVFLDVVYNHFGPEGNYLHTYNRAFFSQGEHTPWGASINFSHDDSGWVRDFFVHNALYWLEEYHLDGLRLDAVDAIADASDPHILTALARAVQETLGVNRHLHLILENDDNNSHLLQRAADGDAPFYRAQWNDDFHHVLHVLLTGEGGGCYGDYVDNPIEHLGRCLSEGFAYQGEASTYRGGRCRGEPSGHLPPLAFVSFLQNHDQVGNRPAGDRLGELLPDLRRLRLAVSLVLLAPFPPMLFMGEEWAASTPFPFFCDFPPELAENVIAGRLEGFSRFPEFLRFDLGASMPSPIAAETFSGAVLDWGERYEPGHGEWLALYRELIHLRRAEIVPLLEEASSMQSRFDRIAEHALSVQWVLGEGVRLTLLANFGDDPVPGVMCPPGRVLFVSDTEVRDALTENCLPGWSAAWFLAKPSVS